MRKVLLLLLLTFLSLVTMKPAFSQNDEKSTLIGNPGDREFSNNICADGAGNKYIGGESNEKGLVVKQDALNMIQWSKTLTFSSIPSDQVKIGFLDVVGDTVFGCGRIFSVVTAFNKGSFYFKMNAQTGTLYWSKYEVSAVNYLSCMRYSNGKFFLIGGGPSGGRVLAVSSQTGQVIWQNSGIYAPVSVPLLNSGTTFSSATEMVNGKLFITGAAMINGLQQQQRPIIIGVDQNGTIFLQKYLAIPGVVWPADEYSGQRIEYDQDQNLILTVNDNQITNTLDPFFLKCDTLGNLLFAKRYGLPLPSRKVLTAVNETATHYVLYGIITDVVQPLYAVKVLKDGTFERSVSILKPNVNYYILNSGGNSTFLNGLHYFSSTESAMSVLNLDINQIILDEDLNVVGDCSEMDELPFVESNVLVSIMPLALNTTPVPLAFSNGAILEDEPFTEPCIGVSLNLNQSIGCLATTIIANATGFTDPTFYWSTGMTGSSNTQSVTTEDTVIVRVLDTKCCELIDTIVPVLASSGFVMSLPADTLVCLQPGNSFTIHPLVSGATAAITYLWSDNSTNSFLNITQSGTYWVDISDSCLTRRDSIIVTVNSLPVIGNTSNMTVCEGDFPVSLNPVVSAGASILWENGSSLIPRSVSGPGTYTITAANSCGTVSVSISITQLDLPHVSLVSSIDTCIQSGGAIALTPSFNDVNTILWSDGSTGNQLTVFNSGTYTVYGSNSCGIDSASCSVTINYFPELDLPEVLDTCFEIGVGFSYTAQGSPGSYQWSSGSQTATEWISQEGMYFVTLTNQCGSITDSMQVNRLIPPDLYFPEDSVRHCQKQLPVSWLHIETNYDLEILAPYHSGTIGHFITESGWYTIHAFNRCWHKWDSIYVDLEDAFFYLPNSFTPNNDGNNDRFEFKGENIVVREIRIFNRWGEEIFTETGSFKGWDGMYGGEICPDGIYAVHFIYEDCFGIPTEFSGHVNLIR